MKGCFARRQALKRRKALWQAACLGLPKVVNTLFKGSLIVPKFSDVNESENLKVDLKDTDRPLAETLNPNFRYALFSPIAKGGKSLIQSCSDLYLSRRICYKSLRREFAEDPVEQKRLLREARVTAILQHPNIVPTYDLGRDTRGHYYFTMKLVHGYTLREVLDYRERYDLTQLVDVIEQVAQALSYAHTKGVIHRDVKPENILVGPFGEVVLLDWGLAKVWDTPEPSASPDAPEPESEALPLTMTRHGKVQGTISYMSPEQLTNETEIDSRADIYSLGAVLYEVLTGQNAAVGETMDELARSVRYDTPALPSQVARLKIPKLLEDLTMRCLKKEPSERLANMEEMIRLLSQNWQLS